MAPPTIPAVQEWAASAGSYRFGPGSTILVDPGAANELTADANTFAADLGALFETAAARVRTAAAGEAREGDIVLALGSGDAQLGDEGYQLEIGPVLRLTARRRLGVFWGTRTVLQQLHASNGEPLTGGRVRDWPEYTVRGALLCNATKHYDLQWWGNQIRDLSYLKFNELVIYVDGIGITRAELEEIARLSERYHVTVLPQLNMPGHMDQVLPPHRQYQLRHPNGEYRANALDISNDAAREWAFGLIEQYLPLFPGPVWHFGADEYPAWAGGIDDFPQLADYARRRYGPQANGWDAFNGFVNDGADRIRRHGKQIRIWSDMQRRWANTVRVQPDVVIEHWTNDRENLLSVPQLLERGHKLVNGNDLFLYYNGGRNPDGSQRKKTDARRIYDDFRPGDMQGGDDLPDNHPALLGIRFCQWNDLPVAQLESSQATELAMFDTLRAVAQHAWGSPKAAANWAALKPVVDNIGRAPGYVPPVTVPCGPGPGVARDGYEVVTFFAPRTDGKVEHGWQHHPGSGPWRSIGFGGRFGGGIAGNTPVTLDVYGRLTYLARTQAGTIECGRQPAPGSGPWTDFRELPVRILGDPAAALDAQGRLTFLARAAEGGLVLGRERTPGYGLWDFTRLDVDAQGDPALVLDGDKHPCFAVRTGGGRILSGRRERPSSGEWQYTTFGADVAGDPALALDRDRKPTVLARLATGRILFGVRDGGSWTTRDIGGGGLVGELTLAMGVQGRLTFFARDGQGNIRHGWQRVPGGPDWEQANLAGGITGDISAIQDHVGRLVLFARNTAGRMLHGWQASPGEGPWEFAELAGGLR
ncbi:hexosaminidase [Crossiella equi]|uniref:Hexosaminidase n=1 Tax=Crossiella equi TaxID=130796 RepID=A0ABS5AA05_9PSEU|nr:glycoside hydrolase family 20 zincin-like fold domain-containing protein [Crossiella equi]MBP2473408.1 hexosaminidase [Crossiella equi]